MTSPNAHLLLLTLCAGCFTTLPAPPPPPRVKPDVELPSGPPPAGHGRVVVVTEGDVPTVIHLVEAASFGRSTYSAYAALHIRRLCTTPCVVDLPYGNHDLRLMTEGDARGSDQVYVDVGEEPSVLRVRRGRRTGGGQLARTAAGLGLLGSVAGIVGGVVWLAEDDAVGPSVTLGGVGALALGIVLWQLDRPTVQPASSVQWRPGE